MRTFLRALTVLVSAAVLPPLTAVHPAGAVTSAARPALSIPGDPRGAWLPPFTGHAVAPRPITVPAVPQHPFMAANGSSNLHGDAYQSDTHEGPGPTGRELAVRGRLQGGLCGSVTFDSRGRIVTVCMTPGLAPRLMLLDPDGLGAIASLTLPGTAGSSPTEVSGGGYFYLDERDRAVVPTKDGTIQVVAVRRDALVTEARYDLKAVIGSSGIVSVLPDWAGRMWFVTGSGVVGVLDPATGSVSTHTLPGETIANSIAVDESGGVFVVSDHALYRFDAAAQGRPVVTWRAAYDRGSRQKPGQLGQGSGTTPTLIGPADGPGGGYVAITDNADPRMRVLVMARGKAGPEKVCEQPVFAPGKGADENSLVAVGGDLVVENNYGYVVGDHALLKGMLGGRQVDTEPGLARVHVDYTSRTCSLAWSDDHERVPSVVSKVSLATGLLYTFTHPSADELRSASGKGATAMPDAWYLTALDVRTGERVWSRLVGSGPFFNNHYAPITLGRDGSAYVGVVGGLVRITDS
ncbi:hypothetical protein ABTX85_08150 [Streptomyces sp. NPDC096097]|uniref:hypothetical protein n=1 Tax=Streptomyces sp. NPDC096097 TaxID=3155546 RepID=UPI00332D1181